MEWYREAAFSVCAGLLFAASACGGEDGDGSGGSASSSTSDASSTAATSGSGGSGTTGSGGGGVGGGAGGGGGSSAATCDGLPLCDGFEDAPAGGPPSAEVWAVTSPNCSSMGSSITVDEGQARSGKKSVKVTAGGNYCDHIFIAHDKSIASIGPVVYGRFFVRLEAALGDGHTTFMTMKDSADGGKDLRMGGQSKILMWNRESDDATLPSLSPAGIAMSVMPSATTWACVEFMADQTNGFLMTWVDGSEVNGLHIDGMPTPDVDQQWLNQKPGWKPSIVDFKLGWEGYAGQGMTLWFDDVALAAQRIGCGGP
jgi:hypothetical protein